jgi:nucleotide-binding universal stress UspA family protein
MFQRCLICTDFSDGLQRLVDFVPSLAAGGIKQIVFLHSVPLWNEGEIPRVDDQGMNEARDRLAVALQNVPAGVEVRVEVQAGQPTEIILKVAKAYQSEIILLGTSNRTLLNEKLFGSTTINLSQRTLMPLMTLRPQLISTYTNEELDLRCQHLFRYLLIPYDSSDAANYVVQQIKHYAQNRPAKSLEQCLLCWAVPEGGRREPKDYQVKQAQEKLKSVKAELESLNLQVHVEVRQGDPVPEIVAAAQVFDISAIAVSAGKSSRRLEWSVPSFSGEVLRRSWHPVIFFPPPK